METALTKFDEARRALALATTVDEVKEIRDRAEALRAYAKQAGESLEMQNQCAEIKLRAERKGGEILKEQEKNVGGRPPENQSHDATTLEPPKLEDIGINKSQSSRWQQMAEVPEDKFEQHLAKTKEAKKELTTNSVLRLSRDIREAKAKEDVGEQPKPTGVYETIVVDPPWPVKKILRESAPNQDVLGYPTMPISEIEAMPVSDIADDDCHLFLWATHKFLPDAIAMLKEWGFKYVLTMVWHKNGGFQPFGLPQYNCEFVVYGRKGSPKFVDTKNFMCCFDGARREHSRKPDEFYDTIKRVTQGPRIDYFSREERKGFEQYGNETGKFTNRAGTGVKVR